MTTNTIITSRVAAMGLTAALALGAAPTFAQDDEIHEKHRIVVHALAEDHGDGVDARTIEVQMNDGDITVVMNGEEIPASRIQHKDGRVVILDENGKEIDNVFIFDGEDHPFVLHGKGQIGLGGEGIWIGDDDATKKHMMLVHPDAHPPKVMLGVSMSEPGAALVKHLRLEAGATTLITNVYEGLPAHEAGMQEHDIITAINGTSPASPTAVREALQKLDAGDVVRFTLIREGERARANVTLAAWDAEKMQGATWFGLKGGPHGPGEFRVERFFGDDEKSPFGKKWREIIVSPDHNMLFEFPKVDAPDADELHKKLRDRLEHSFRLRLDGEEHDADEIEERLDALNDLMEELEDALSDVMKKIEDEDGE